MTNNNPKRLLDVKAAAAYLSISRALLYQCIGAGKIPIIKLRKRTLIDVHELDVFIENLKKEQRGE